MSIKITCTQGKITVYPKTGVTTPNDNSIPLVADPTGKSFVLKKDESMTVEAMNYPAIGGKFLGGASEFVVIVDGDLPAVHWHELDNDPIYAEEMQGYVDLESGEHTDVNYTDIMLLDGKPYAAKVVTSNVLTLTIMAGGASIQPIDEK